MRDFEDDFDFEFEKGIRCQRTRDFRIGDTQETLSGVGHSTVNLEQVFTPEREARVKAHRKRIQKEMKKRRKLVSVR